MALPRAKTFRKWVEATFGKKKLIEIADRGAGAVWDDRSYGSDEWELFEAYGDEVWAICAEAAKEEDLDTLAFLSGQLTPETVELAETPTGLVKLALYVAVEEVAASLVGEAEPAFGPKMTDRRSSVHVTGGLRHAERIAASDDRAWMIEWLIAMDPNGVYGDRARAHGDMDPMTLEEARTAMKSIMEDM